MCGVRVSEKARRCLVCGTDLTRPDRWPLREGKRPPPHPLVIGILLMMVALGSLLLLLAMGVVSIPTEYLFGTPTITLTFTPIPSGTPTRTATATLVPSETPKPPMEYVVKDGDSCLLIAIINDVTVESLIQLNALDPDCTLTIGTKILVPHPTPTPTVPPPPSPRPGMPSATVLPYATYVVVSGDTCYSIAYQFGMTLDDLVNKASISNCGGLREGQILNIPITPTPSP